MHCLKCGKETNENQVFCDTCLAVMESYPVKPGTAVHLPQCSQTAPLKKVPHRKRAQSPEEQVAALKKQIRHLHMMLLVALVAACLFAAILVHNHLTEHVPSAVGRNYTIDTSGNP